MHLANLPACCTPSRSAGTAERLYCAYQSGGPADRAGLNFRGEPCPTWAELIASTEPALMAVVAKWQTVADAADNSHPPVMRSNATA